MITKLISESYLTAAGIRTYTMGEIKRAEIFKNPTMSEIRSCKGDNGNVRGFLDNNGNLYAWNPEHIHTYVINFLVQKGYIGITADSGYPSSYGVSVEIVGNDIFIGESNNWNSIMSNEEMIKGFYNKMKQRYPSFNYYVTTSWDKNEKYKV